jgi:hypothetical protein
VDGGNHGLATPRPSFAGLLHPPRFVVHLRSSSGTSPRVEQWAQFRRHGREVETVGEVVALAAQYNGANFRGLVQRPCHLGRFSPEGGAQGVALPRTAEDYLRHLAQSDLQAFELTQARFHARAHAIAQ